MAKAKKVTKPAKKSKSDHTWRRAPGGWKCTRCRMFKSNDDIFYPAGGKPAIDGSKRKTEPKCEPAVQP